MSENKEIGLSTADYYFDLPQELIAQDPAASPDQTMQTLNSSQRSERLTRRIRLFTRQLNLVRLMSAEAEPSLTSLLSMA